MDNFSRSNIKTIRDLVYTAAQRFGDDPFVRTRVKKEMVDKSFNTFKRDADAMGVWLQKNFGRRMHAAVIGSTSYEYLVCWFGASVSGNVAVPLDAGNKPQAIADEINRSDSELVFVDSRHENDVEIFKELCPKVKYYVHMNKKMDGMLYLPELVSQYEGEEPEGDIDPASMTAILFTSGTTGQSKGVMLSHANLVDNATCEPDMGYRGNKRLTVLPIHHVFCFTCDILCSLWFGRIVCVNDALMRIPKNLKAYQPVDATFVPMIAVSILNKMKLAAQDNPDKKAIGRETFGEEFDILYSGGAYLSPEVIDGYREFGIEIAQGYGMTECSPRICTGVKSCPKPDSVGHIVPGCEVKIVDGEVWVKSPSVMMGYYKNPEETAKTLTPDGWLKTGDLGHKDEDGYLYLTGRKKNLIILSNGENVSPEEIENKFAYYEPVKEIVVYGKDGTVTAEVYPNPEYESDDIRAEIQNKIDEVNEEFSAAKRIHSLVIRDTEFEKTASKKIKRNLVGI